MVSTNALFCSASEWPLFFRVFSFFPRLIFSTGAGLVYYVTMSSHLVCFKWPLCWAINCFHRLFSPVVCCPTALSWLQHRFPLSVELTANGSVRVRQPLFSGLHTASTAWDTANRWMWVNMSGKASTPVAMTNTRSKRQFYYFISAVLLLLHVWLRISLAEILLMLAGGLTCSLADVSKLASLTFALLLTFSLAAFISCLVVSRFSRLSLFVFLFFKIGRQGYVL